MFRAALFEEIKEVDVNFSVRALVAEDQAFVLELLKTTWPDAVSQAEGDMSAFLEGSFHGTYPCRFVVAETEAREIVGMSAWCEEPFASDVYGLCWAVVHPSFRRQGVNTLMLQYRLQCIRDFSRSGFYHVIVRTWDVPLYRSYGFSPGHSFPDGKSLLLACFDGSL